MDIIRRTIPGPYAALFPVVALVLYLAVIITASDAVDLVRLSAPDGQILYLLSKLAGLTALALLFWQFITAVLGKVLNFQAAPAGKRLHLMLGIVVLSLVILHAGLFVSAVSARSGHPALHILLPNFNGYYSTALSLGVLALYCFLIAVFTRKLLARFPVLQKIGHMLVYPAVVLVPVHAYMVGSEAQAPVLLPIVGVILFGSFTAIVLRLAHRRNKSSSA